MDVRLPPGFRDEGLRAALRLRSDDPAAKVLIVSQYVERAYAAELLADGRGGVGYLLKDRVTALDDFLDAVERVAAGGTAMDPEVVRHCSPAAAATTASTASPHANAKSSG